MRIKVRNPFTKATVLAYERNQSTVLKTGNSSMRLIRTGWSPWYKHTSTPASKGDLSLIMILKCPPLDVDGDLRC